MTRPAGTCRRNSASRCWARATRLTCRLAAAYAWCSASGAARRGLTGGGGRDKVTRHQAGRPLPAQRQGGGKLQHPLRPAQRHLERRPLGIAPPRRPGDPAASLGQERIVQAHHQRCVRRQFLLQRLPRRRQQGLRGGPVALVEPVVGGPVAVLAVLGGVSRPVTV
jgi:hypothetical protein